MDKPASRRGKPVDVTQNLSYRLLLLSNTLARSAARDLAEVTDVSVPEWRIVSVVGIRGPISLNDLAQTIAVDKAWVSRTVVALEKKGLIQRAPLPTDGRLFSLKLTEAGKALHLEASEWSQRRQKRLKAVFTAQEYAQFEGFVERLQAVAETMLDPSPKGDSKGN
ncbi:MarR family winged helix-turn-helix transcriptional regulator [Paraburkholderia tagetis]|uniref:MarR family transcriptional regulator n=1 Tax=Paraburkholderia tagetis TaxID=2913261 RepID=A0A9X1RIS2_9BURK|nr:MarR family transcriptional regulator [Paraburkholderia tagetis]MCG5073246.1 MarR family transcriptional regulator [Paraburkholderia tagetis]